MAIAVATTVATIVLPINAVTTGICVFLVGQTLSLWRWQQVKPSNSEQVAEQTAESSKEPTPNRSRNYRASDLERIVAFLLADSSLLVVGKEGIGKTTLCDAVFERLDEDYKVIKLGKATPKNILKDMASQLGLINDLDAKKSLNADQLKVAIAAYLQSNCSRYQKVFVIIDDAHRCDSRFRDWLKTLKYQGVPLLLFATDPPRTDIFINLPRIELGPLPDYCIREIMEQVAIEHNLSLKPHRLASIQQRAGGNPMLAKRGIKEEYLGLDPEAGDHYQYFDGTPIFFLIRTIFVASKFLARGFNDPVLYVISGVASAVFMGFSRFYYTLPKESKRIE